MAHPVATTLREQLLERRRRLESAIPVQQNAEHLLRLLNEVDSALGRIESGSYGLCATCNEPIEREWLAVDPLARTCLDHMSAEQRQALEQDLQVACRIQAALLPRNNLKLAGWDICYQYEPAGAVGGDYCDILPVGNDILFAIADVSGKGVGPAMLASQLHAIFRSIIAVDQPLGRLMERVNRIFCGSTTPSRFATLCAGGRLPPEKWRSVMQAIAHLCGFALTGRSGLRRPASRWAFSAAVSTRPAGCTSSRVRRCCCTPMA